MKVKINEREENSLLGRVKVTGLLEFEGTTPSNVKLIEFLVKEFDTDANKVVIKKIGTKFSSQEADFLAFVYNNNEAKNKTERVTKHMKKKMEEVAKKAREEKEAAEEAKKAEE